MRQPSTDWTNLPNTCTLGAGEIVGEGKIRSDGGTAPGASASDYVQGLRLRERLRRSRLEQAFQAKREAAARMASVLKREFGARKVWLIGSLTDHSRFHEKSDIDLAVEGLSPEAFWHAWGRLEGIAAGSFDLVTVETAPSSPRQRLQSEGVEL